MKDGLEELKRLDRVCKALAHPNRRHILVVVHARGGTMTAGEIADRFSCAWPTTTRHLKQLEEAGLLTVSKEGRIVHYSLNSMELRTTLENFVNNFEEK